MQDFCISTKTALIICFCRNHLDTTILSAEFFPFGNIDEQKRCEQWIKKTHDRFTSSGITQMKKAIAVIALTTTSFIIPPGVDAAPIGEGCVSDFWMWRGIRSAERVICDGPRAADG